MVPSPTPLSIRPMPQTEFPLPAIAGLDHPATDSTRRPMLDDRLIRLDNDVYRRFLSGERRLGLDERHSPHLSRVRSLAGDQVHSLLVSYRAHR